MLRVSTWCVWGKRQKKRSINISETALTTRGFVTNEDIINKLLISSDPYISSLRTEWKHSPIPIDVEAQNLLL